jgi:hypothetical protein
MRDRFVARDPDTALEALGTSGGQILLHWVLNLAFRAISIGFDSTDRAWQWGAIAIIRARSVDVETR